jgi:hypothetical protein
MSDGTHDAYLSPEMAQLIAHYGTDLARRSSSAPAGTDDADEASPGPPRDHRIARWRLRYAHGAAVLHGAP